ncbi:M42 family metallopeptidase [Arthrospira platensis]|uniref:Glucanase n=1 Tax=Limnospira platensis NIES-46 TaxID=1236695 RepID=A0A5M3TA27_LIMPL|nr:M20/M25/M40 family metallo-hydrolase [Arthrospira platensis]AMW29949.1 peptidase M42 [Arthrospira platensis YZ]KDR54342.1 peptidase M42 [Arthrospira platensis str. Paraca]MBD2671262.1 M28 family peptidase [Arthrospira platensis FACHB-439]MBD2712195.1 M28 family peptidase [Arthrospira platensis FACHB-835]MDF2212010.1 M28 family peptidase [Arthrospira platensis NCB002]MDT9184904.1 M28 family peptidase [Limnospira sp. PMC 289.06]MDT9296480.1 M28 family peptidase [Arthrospira platensis PCC 73
MEFDQLFATIEQLVMCHSPSGDESEIDSFLLDRFSDLGVKVWKDQAENVIAEIPGQNPDVAIAITGHKDEIGAIVNNIEPNGRVMIRKLGGSFPWVYGEGVVDLRGDHQTISGILSFGSRHISHESPQKSWQTDKVLTWEDVWVETLRSPEDLEAAGVRPGTRVVVGKHRKKPFRMGDYIASYTLDNKASVAILLELAKQIKNPPVTVYLVASAKEEVGAIGALYFTNRTRLDALIALEICPLAPEYPIESGEKPVLLSQDGYGIYDEGLNAELRKASQRVNVSIQSAIIRGFGSDASIAMKFGHISRAACLSFPTQNTHGFEIAHLGAISHCISILLSYCQGL